MNERERKRQENRAIDPELTKFVDECRERFGAKVLELKRRDTKAEERE